MPPQQRTIDALGLISITIKRQITNVLKFQEVMNKQVLQYLCAQVQEWKHSETDLSGNVKVRIMSGKKILKISEGP